MGIFTATDATSAGTFKADQQMYDFLFEQSPVSLWEEDYSQIMVLVKSLPSWAREDIPAYFQQNPGDLDRFIQALRVININRVTLELFQAPDKPSLLANLHTLFTPSARDTFIAELGVLARGERAYSCETEIKTLKGELRLIALRFHINSKPNGEPLMERVLLTMSDITDFVMATQTMKNERDRANRYLNLSNVLFVSQDTSGKVKQVNNKTCAVLELSRTEIIEKTWLSSFVIPELHASDGEVFQHLANGDVESAGNHESQLMTSTGQVAIVEWHHAVLRNIAGEVDEILSFGVDVTRSRFLEIRNRAMELELHQTERMKSLSILARGVAHEINNPMTAIMNYASIISDEDQNPELQEYARIIQEEGRRVSRIVSNFLSFARQDDSRPEITRVKSIMEDVRLLINQTMMKDRIVLRIADIDPKLAIRCKVAEIQHVLFNILMNSWEAIRKKTFIAGEEKQIQVSAGNLNISGTDYIRIDIRDNGIGISASELDQIFVPFLSGEVKPPGIGLGLEVALKIVRGLGGDLHFQSEEHMGTTASIDLVPAEEGVFK